MPSQKQLKPGKGKPKPATRKPADSKPTSRKPAVAAAQRARSRMMRGAGISARGRDIIQMQSEGAVKLRRAGTQVLEVVQ